MAIINGTDGNDVINGTDYSDVIHGGGGNDHIMAGGIVSVYAEDVFVTDYIYGDEGDDVLEVGDFYKGELSYLYVTALMYGGDGNDIFYSYDSFVTYGGLSSTMYGGKGDDYYVIGNDFGGGQNTASRDYGIVELVDEGFDLVEMRFGYKSSYTLPDNVEGFVSQGGPFYVTGNALDNYFFSRESLNKSPPIFARI